MTSLSDTLTVGLVLMLLFGSIALYLYTRIQQAEQKISLLESILLDLKMSSEIQSYSELPASNKEETVEQNNNTYKPFNEEINNTETIEEDDIDNTMIDSSDIAEYKSIISNAVSTPDLSNDIDLHSSQNANSSQNALFKSSEVLHSEIGLNNGDISKSSTNNYETMTLKELQTLAKSRGILGVGSMKKGSIIEAIKTSDRTPIEPGSTMISSFLETSSPFPVSDESQ